MTKHWRDDVNLGAGCHPIGKAFGQTTGSLRDSTAAFATPYGARLIKKKKTLTFDSLEPRYLLSADISPYIDAIDDGLDRLSLLVDDLQTFEEMAQPIPVIGDSISAITNFAETLEDELIDPIRTVLDDIQNGTSALLADGVVEAAELGDALNLLPQIDFSGAEVNGVATFTGSFSSTSAIGNQLFKLGAEAETFGLSFGADFDLSTEVALDLAFGVMLDPLLSPSESFFIDDSTAASLTASLSGNADVTAGASKIDLGLLGGAGIDLGANGEISLSASVDIALIDPEPTTAGAITGEDLDNNTIDALVAVTPGATNALNVSFDVAAPTTDAISGLSGTIGSVSAQIVGDFYGDFEIDVTADSSLVDFARVSPSLLLSFVGDLGAKLSSLSQVFTEVAQVDFLNLNVGDLANFTDLAREFIAGLSLPGLVGVEVIDLDEVEAGVDGGLITFDIDITETDGSISTQQVSVDPTTFGANVLDDLVSAINDDLTDIVAEQQFGQLVLTATGPNIAEIRLDAVNLNAVRALGLQAEQAGVPLPTFDSIQEFATQVVNLPLFASLPVNLAYDAATNSLTFTLDLLDESFGESLNLSFEQMIELGPVDLSLVGAVDAMINATANLQIGAGLDLAGLDTLTSLDDLNGGAGVGFSLNGGTDLVFSTANGGSYAFSFGATSTSIIATEPGMSPVETTIAGAVDTVGDLIEVIREGTGGDNLGSAGAVTLAIDILGNGFDLSDNTEGPSALTVTGGELSSAIFDLGFGFGAVLQQGFDTISTGLLQERFFIDASVTNIGVSAEVSADNIDLFGALGFIEVGVQGGQLGGTLSAQEVADNPGIVDADAGAAGVQLEPLGFSLSLPLADVFGSDGRIFLTELSQQASDANLTLDPTGFSANADMMIELHDGSMFDVDFTTETTFDEAIATIEEASRTGGAGTERVNVFLNSTGNGLIIEDLTVAANTAVGALTLTANPVDGDTVTVGSNIFEFDTGDGVDAGRVAVAIGGDLAVTGANLVAAIDGTLVDEGDPSEVADDVSVNAAGAGDASAFTITVTLDTPGAVDPDLRQALSQFGDVWEDRTFRVTDTPATGPTPSAAEQLGLDGFAEDTDGDGFIRGEAVAGADYAVLSLLDFDNLANNGLDVSTGQLLLPLVFQGGGGFGIEDQTFYLLVGFTEGSIALDFDFDNFDFSELFDALGNLQAPDLLTLVTQLGSLFNDQFDFLNADIPLIDVSFNDVTTFVGDQLEDLLGDFTNQFAAVSGDLTGTAPEAAQQLLDILAGELGGLDAASLDRIVESDGGMRFLMAIESVNSAFSTILGSFDLFFSDTPTQIISAFAALQAAYRDVLRDPDLSDITGDIETAFGDAIETIENSIPSTENLLRLLHQALGFDLPDIDDIAPTLETIQTAIDDVAGAARMAVEDLQAILDGLDPGDIPSNIGDIDDFIAQATAFIDGLSGDALADDLSDRLQSVLDGVEDGLSDIFDLVDLVPDILAKIDDLTALLETDLTTLLTELAQQAQDDFIAAIEALAADYTEQIRDALFQDIFQFGVLDFSLDTANGVFDIGLLLEPKFIDLSAQGLSLDFTLDPFPVGAEFNDLNLDFEVGGLVDVGLRLEYGGADFDLLVDGGSEIELNALLIAEGEVALKLGAIGVQLGDQPDDPARIALTDLSGENPAFFNIGIDGGMAGDFVSIGSVGFEVDAEARVEAGALFFDSSGAAIITDPNDDGDTADGAQVEIGLTATVDENLAFDFAGDGLDQDEIDAILESLIAFDLTTILDAIETFLELAEIGLGEDALGSLPIVGDDFTGAADKIEDFREQIFGPFRDALESVDQGGEVIALLQTAIHNAIGSDGFDLLPDIGEDATEIDISLVLDSDYAGTEEDATLLDIIGVVIEPLTIGLGLTEEFDFDFGLDALIFELASEGGVTVDLQADFTLGFGASLDSGAFLVLPDDGMGGVDDIFEGSVSATVDDDTELYFELFFLGLEATPWEGANDVNGEGDKTGDGVGISGAIQLNYAPTTSGLSPSGNHIVGLGDALGGGIDFDLEAQANIDLFLRAGITDGDAPDGLVDDNLPSLTTYLDVQWEWSLDDPDAGGFFAAFWDTSLDFGEFLSGPLGELVDSIQTYTAPLDPFLDFLDLEIPIISQLSELFGQGEVTFVDAIRILGSGAESVEVLLDILDTVDTVIDVINAFDTSDDLAFNFGDLVLVNTFADGDPEAPDDGGMTAGTVDLRQAGQRSQLADTGMLGMLADNNMANDQLQSEGFLADLIGDLNDIGVNIPLLSDPGQIFGLLFGQRVDLVTWDIPRLEAEFGVSYKFGPILPPVPLFVTIGGGFNIFLDLAVGYDTRGLETGDFFDGFYFSDYDENGDDILELGLGVFFEATASLSVLIAEAGVTGGVEAEIGANFNDVEEDGKFYLDEIGTRAQQSIFCIFDLEGALQAFLEAFVRLGFDTPFGFVTLFEDSFELLRVTLLDFSLSCPPLPPPMPATAYADGAGDLAVQLNVGIFADERQSGADGEADETIEVFGESDDLNEVASNVSIWDGGADLSFFDGDNKLTATEVQNALAAGSSTFNRNLDLNGDDRIDTDEIRAVTDFAGDAGSLSDDWILVIGFGEWEIFQDVSKIYGDAAGGDDIVYIDPTTVMVTAEIGGGAGDDELTGGAGDDVIVGGGGEDIIRAFDGDDEILGDGTISVSATSAATTNAAEAGSDGVDRIFGGLGADDIEGGGGDDAIEGYGEDEEFAALDGGDVVDGGSGNDGIVTGAGDDSVRGEGGSDNIDTGDGDDTIRGGDEIDLIIGGFGADSIFGDDGNDIIYGETTDLLEIYEGGLAVSDRIFGGDGDDEIRSQFGDDFVRGGAGADRLIGGLGDDTIHGDADVDTIYGDRLPADGFINRGEGDDSIEGGAAGDRIFAGAGDDSVIGGASNTGEYGLGEADGSDLIRAGAGDDIVLGDDGTISDDENYATDGSGGSGGVDTIYGETGSDVLAGGNYVDFLYGDNIGGAGEDLMAGDQLSRAGTLVQSASGAGGNDSVDIIIGYGGADIAIGGGDADIVLSGLGNDLIVGDYADILLKADTSGLTLFESIRQVTTTNTGVGGNDRLIADRGDDIVLGGFGDDTISGGGGTDGDDILVGDNAIVYRDDLADGDLRNDILSIAPGDAGADIITGGAGADVIIGGGDEDTLSGQAGMDLILGDYGDVARDNATSPNLETVMSTFTSTGADDNIFGGLGVDIAIGGLGDDIIEGAAGADILLGDNGEVVYNGADGDITTADEVRTIAPANGGGADVILGQDGGDIAMGGLGDDRIYGDFDVALTRDGLSGDIIIGAITGAANGGNDILLGDNGELLQFGGSPTLLTSTETALGGADLIEGHDGNDIAIGGFASDVIHGDAPAATNAELTAPGNDVLLGDSGEVDWVFDDDTDQATIDRVRVIDAGVGDDDVILGNDGDDIAMGGAGNDFVLGDFAANVNTATLTVSGRLEAGAGEGGDDVLLGDAGDLVLVGGLSDELTSTDTGIGGDDTIEGHDGADVLIGGAARDIVHGEAATAFQSLIDLGGGDVALGDSGFVSWSAFDGDQETVDLVESIDAAIGGDDVIFGGSLNDIAMGGAGDDLVFGDFVGNVGSAYDADGVSAVYTVSALTTPVTAAGLDVLAGDSARLEQSGGAPVFFTSTNTGIGGRDRIEGHDFDDALLGGADSDVLFGEAPEATRGQVGTSGDDAILGDSGFIDWVETDGSQATIDVVSSLDAGVGGADLIFGNDGDDIAFGGADDDQIFGDFYANADLTGLTGPFTAAGDGGSDILLGDSGVLTQIGGDLATVESIDFAIGGDDLIEGQDFDDIILGGAGADLAHGETDAAKQGLIGAPVGDETADDVIFGDSGEVIWTGADGDQATIDEIRSLAEGIGGDDAIFGNDGGDILIGGAFDDLILGDFYADIAFNAAADDPLDRTRAFTASNHTAANDAGVEYILGDSGEILQSNGRIDAMTSTAFDIGGDDLIEGHGAGDVAIGGTGRDEIHGDAPELTRDQLDPLSGDETREDILLGDEGFLSWIIRDGDQTSLDLISTISEDAGVDLIGGRDAIFGNDDRDVMLGGGQEDLIFGDSFGDAELVNGAFENLVLTDGNREARDTALGDQGFVDYAPELNAAMIYGIDGRPDLAGGFEGLIDPGFVAGAIVVRSTDPTNGGGDLILGDGAADLIIGGTGDDRLGGDSALDDVTEQANDGDDVIFGDHGQAFQADGQSDNAAVNGDDWFAIDTQADQGGLGDLISGGGGDDRAQGQQGDDVLFGGTGYDDLIGGHNAANGADDLDGMNAAQVAATGDILADLDPTDLQEVNDIIDGGVGEDVILGDNGVILRDGAVESPRHRGLTGAELYSTTGDTINVDGVDYHVDLGFQANVGAPLDSPDAELPRTVFLFDFDAETEDAAAANPADARPFGDDVIAGGSEDDEIWGQLGDDIIQGDGSIDIVPAANADIAYDPSVFEQPTFTIPDQTIDSNPLTPIPPVSAIAEELVFSVFEDATDGDDYVEGNGGNDRIYGNIGQDDLIGGSSELYAVTFDGTPLDESDRPDGADLIYGGAGALNDLARNSFGDGDHVRDADYILGDNGNIFHILANGADAQFNYAIEGGYGGLEVRAVELLDYEYTLNEDTDLSDGLDHKISFNDFGVGAGDLIHGESGDDVIHGMTGDDAIFGESGDDDIFGEAGADFLYGGTGQDGILGDDGLLKTSRNVANLGEDLFGVDPLRANDIDKLIRTPGNLQLAIINREGELDKEVDLIAFDMDGVVFSVDGVADAEMTSANDIIFGGLGLEEMGEGFEGLGGDWIHGGFGDDAISGAEALSDYYDGGVDSWQAVNDFLKAQQDNGDLDAAPAAADDPFWVSFAPYNPGDILRFGADDDEEFDLYDEDDPRRVIRVTETVNGADVTRQFLLNFDAYDTGAMVDDRFELLDPSLTQPLTDGDDYIFGDLGNDWAVGGTGRDHFFGGRGADLLNMDDDHFGGSDDPADLEANNAPDPYQQYADIAYDGAGRDVLILNTGADRAIAWVGEYNTYLVPFSPFGAFHISRSLQPQTEQFVLDLAEASGSDQSTPDILRYAEQFFIDDKIDAPDPDRNFEPFGELGMVRQEDVDWQDQTGSPDDPQAGNDPGQRDIMRRDLWMADAPKGNSMKVQLADLEVAESDFVEAALANPDLTADELAALGAEPVILSYQPETASDEVILFGDFDPAAMDVIDISTTVEVSKAVNGLNSNAYLVFDHQSDADYKFAGVDVQRNKAQIGMKVGDDWVILAEVQLNLKPNTPYDLNVVIDGVMVRLSVDGQEMLVYDFDEDLMDGQIGIASDNAVAAFSEVDIVAEAAPVEVPSTEDEPAGEDSAPSSNEDASDGLGEIDWGDTGVDDGEPAPDDAAADDDGSTGQSSDTADEDESVVVVESWLPRTDFESSMIA